MRLQIWLVCECDPQSQAGERFNGRDDAAARCVDIEKTGAKANRISSRFADLNLEGAATVC